MKFFYRGIEIDVPGSVYYPREDSELLATAIEKIDLKNRSVLEVGCGSGLLSIIMAKNGARVTAVDINEKAVKATKRNAEKNDAGIDVFVSNMFNNVKEKFDLILFNPPYLPIGQDDIDDITYSGGSSGREIIEHFVSHIGNYLNKDGKIMIVISSLTGEKEVIELFRCVGMQAKSVERQKIPWEELIVIEAK